MPPLVCVLVDTHSAVDSAMVRQHSFMRFARARSLESSVAVGATDCDTCQQKHHNDRVVEESEVYGESGSDQDGERHDCDQHRSGRPDSSSSGSLRYPSRSRHAIKARMPTHNTRPTKPISARMPSSFPCDTMP